MQGLIVQKQPVCVISLPYDKPAAVQDTFFKTLNYCCGSRPSPDLAAVSLRIIGRYYIVGKDFLSVLENEYVRISVPDSIVKTDDKMARTSVPVLL